MNASRILLSIDRRLVALFAGLMLGGSSPAYSQNGAVGIAYPVKGISVDGDLSDWPKDLQTYPIECIEFGDKLGGKDDLTAHFQLAYNPAEHALYFAVIVRDDSIVGLDGSAATQAADGAPLSDHFLLFRRSWSDLPPRAELVRELRELGSRLTALRGAALLDQYNGPVLFEGQAAAELFAQVFAQRLVARKRP